MKQFNSIILAVFLTGFSVRMACAQDYPNLKRYHDADQALKDSTVSAVYMGDSITDFWFRSDSVFFKGNHYADRGISAQISPQMLIRFRQDVIDLRPKVVVILCGINDIAGNGGPMTLEMTEDNIKNMTELARANKIKVVLCSLLPADHFYWKPELRPAQNVIELNAWIKAYAYKNHLEYVDYYTPLVNGQGGIKGEYSEDGVHPNAAGYKVMETLVQAAIKKYNK